MNRIDQRFASLRAAGRKGFILYLAAGDPNLAATRELAVALDRIGVDVLELGVPFSDPLADGPVNQQAAQRALAAGATPPKVLATVAAIRRESQIPIVFYIYYNLVHRYGVDRFVRDCAAAGVDGLLVLDLPPEEAGDYDARMKEAGLCAIYLVAPTTPEARMAAIARRGSGFLYYVSREGVTGMRDTVSASIGDAVARLRACCTLPIAVGFGISNAGQAQAVARQADAVVVGSAVVQRVGEFGSQPDLVERVCGFVGELVRAVKEP